VTEWDELAHNWFSEILLGPKKMGLEALWCFGFFRLFLHAEAFTELKAPP